MINFTSILWICQISTNYKKGENMNDYHEEKQKIGIPAIGIPGEVAFNHFLTDKEKILFGFIRNLSRSRKGCWASNRYLGNLIRAKPQTISGAITK